MSGSENGNGNADPRPIQVSPGRTIGGGRSASPAKRRAADMEGGSGDGPTKPPGSFKPDDQEEESLFDVAMEEIKSGNQTDESQETVRHSMANSKLGEADQASTSITIEPPPPAYSTEDPNAQVSTIPVFTTQETDQQYANMLQLANQELDEGSRGVILSRKWLDRVRSRTTEGLSSKDYPKEAREGPVGMLDNSDLVPEGAFAEPYLHDPADAPFVPLRPGLVYSEDYEALPYSVYEAICATYGTKEAKSIRRYAHDTAPDGATQQNIQFEMYPPIITVRKVIQPGSGAGTTVKHTKSLDALKARRDQATRGQRSPDEAPRLVSSKSEKYQKFLRRAKEAAGISLTTKVKVWRVKRSDDISVDRPDNKQPGVLSPPASRDASPEKPEMVKLVVDQDTFQKMDVGVELEATDAKDETNNEKYNGSSTMEVLGFFEDSTILLEEQIGGPAGGEFQSDSKKIKTSFLGTKNRASKPASAATSGRTSPAPGMVTRGRARKDGRTRGTIGLSNLGNTCYMNSALQCIRSVEELAIYFLTGAFNDEINNDNPLGYYGQMANAYHTVIKGIYGNANSSSFSPNEFKRKLGTYQPMFSGYGQQDSQEFLSFLVDALHEDLNRIKKKPYIENPDSDDARIHDPEYIIELGETYRTNHRQRNDSIAMDLFSGFYKNTMECPTCDKVSVTFDPYSLVTVQLPMEITWQHNITYVPRRGKPVIHQIDVDKNWTIKALKDHLAKKHPGANSNALWMVEVYNHHIYKIFDDATTIAEAAIATNDYIFIYELDQVPKNTAKKSNALAFNRTDKVNAIPDEGMDSEKADVFSVPIFSRTKSGLSGQFSKGMHPLYITLTRDEAKDYEVILKKILITVANTTSRPILKEFDEDSSESTSIEEIDAENDNNGSEDAAGVSDHSAPSEEGYVNISLDKPSTDVEMTNGEHDSSKETTDEETYVPSNFMDAQYFLSPALRHQLFEVKVAQSSESNMHLAGLGGYSESSIQPMPDRVKKPSRRSSVQSASSEESTTSSASETQTNDATDDSDDHGGINEEPDLVLKESVEESDEEAVGAKASTEIMEPSEVDNGRSNRRGGKKNKRKNKRDRRGNRNGQITYGKKDKARFGQNRGVGGQFAPKRWQEDDSPYYVQLGEGIVLDWRPEAVDSLYGGDAKLDDDMRGHRFVDDNGKNGRIFPDPEQDAKRHKREQRKKHGVDLEDCFEVTRRREILSEGNEWYCNRCKEMRQAAKTLEIWTLPDILVVHLKRFGGNRSFRDKIDLLVEYPVEGLDMNGKVGLKEDGKDYTYDLFAVDLHFGGLGGGHYTAYAKNFYDGEWYDYNDSSVSKLSNQDRLQSAAAYLLFYRRRSDKPLGPQELQDLVNKYREPPVSAEEVEDDGSGEGRLGGPTHSPHGSPSVLAGAVAGAKNRQKGLSGNGGVGHDSNLTTKAMEMTDEENTGNRGLADFQNGADWGFDHLDNNNESNEADALLDQVDDNDNASTGVEMDHDSGMGSPSSLSNFNSGAQNSPDPPTFVDMSGTGHVEEFDEAAAEIHLSELDHDKMD